LLSYRNFGSPAIGSGKPARSQRPSRFFGEITTLFRTTFKGTVWLAEVRYR